MYIDEITRSSFELYCSIYADKYMRNKKIDKNKIEEIKIKIPDEILTTVNCMIESCIENIIKESEDLYNE